MIYRLFDVSGTVSLSQMNSALADCKTGDRVIAFDTVGHDLGIFTSAKEMLAKIFTVARGGTLLGPALKLVPRGAAAVVYTDGYILDAEAANGSDVTFAIYPQNTLTRDGWLALRKVSKDVRFL